MVQIFLSCDQLMKLPFNLGGGEKDHWMYQKTCLCIPCRKLIGPLALSLPLSFISVFSPFILHWWRVSRCDHFLLSLPTLTLTADEEISRYLLKDLSSGLVWLSTLYPLGFPQRFELVWPPKHGRCNPNVIIICKWKAEWTNKSSSLHSGAGGILCWVPYDFLKGPQESQLLVEVNFYLSYFTLCSPESLLYR